MKRPLEMNLQWIKYSWSGTLKIEKGGRKELMKIRNFFWFTSPTRMGSAINHKCSQIVLWGYWDVSQSSAD